MSTGHFATFSSMSRIGQRVTPDAWHAGEHLVAQVPTGEWVERAPYFEAVAVTGDGVFDTLKAVSKLVLKSLS